MKSLKKLVSKKSYGLQKNIQPDTRDYIFVPQEQVDAVFGLLEQGQYQAAYEQLKKKAKSEDQNVDKGKIYFTLGFILEFNLTKDRNINSAQLPRVIREYYDHAIEAGCIEAKARKCYFDEKNNMHDVETQYRVLISEYRKKKDDKSQAENLKLFAANAAFAHFRLGRMYEKQKPVTEDHINQALSYYKKSLWLYDSYTINNLDKARVLNRIGWIESAKFAIGSQKYNTEEEFAIATHGIMENFKQAQDLELHKADLGILNLKVLLHERINKKVSFEHLKTEINKALKAFPAHIKTLINKAKVENIAPSDDGTIALNVIRKVLTLNPDNSEGKKLLSQVAKGQAINLGRAISKRIHEETEYIVATGSEQNATREMKDQASEIQKNFYPKYYVDASWFKKKFLSKDKVNQYLEEQIVWLTSIVTEVLGNSDTFKNQYMSANKQELVKELTNILLTNEINVVGKIIEDKKNDIKVNTLNKKRYGRFVALIETSLKKICNEKAQSALVMTQEEYKLMDVQSRLQALVSEKFRVGRNAIEAIAGGRVLPLPDTIDDMKYILDRGLMAMNIPPLCYIGNLLGGNALTYLIGAFVTDAAYKLYKDTVVNANKEVDEMLPRGQDSINLIDKVSKELARKYGAQLVNIKDDKSLEFLADAAVERMMNHLFAHTGVIQKIKESPKDCWNHMWGKDPVPIDIKKMLDEGIYKGESNNEKRFLHTTVTEGRYGKDWVADGIFSKAGIMLEDGRIFGMVHDIKKYGCIIGTEDEVKNRGLSPVNQKELSPELIDKMKKVRDKQVHAQKKLENIAKPVENQTCIHNEQVVEPPYKSSKSLITGLLVTSLSLLFWIFPEIPVITSLIPGALPLIANFVSGTFVSGIGISVWGLIHKVCNTTATSQDVNDIEKIENVKDEPLEIMVPFIKERVKGPSYVDLVKRSRDNMEILMMGI